MILKIQVEKKKCFKAGAVLSMLREAFWPRAPPPQADTLALPLLAPICIHYWTPVCVGNEWHSFHSNLSPWTRFNPRLWIRAFVSTIAKRFLNKRRAKVENLLNLFLPVISHPPPLHFGYTPVDRPWPTPYDTRLSTSRRIYWACTSSGETKPSWLPWQCILLSALGSQRHSKCGWRSQG